MELLVYDYSIKAFRQIDETNYNDDIVCGTVILQRDSLSEIKKYFHICGYVIIEKETGDWYPIDIQREKVVLFEGTYNCMPQSLRESLIQYNVRSLPDKIWSLFFIEWQFMCNINVFENHGSFIKLCSRIIGSQQVYSAFIKSGIELYEPVTYRELCDYTRNILNLTNLDINSDDYYERIKYLIDSLVKGYHINFTDEEVTLYFYQISQLVDERWDK